MNDLDAEQRLTYGKTPEDIGPIGELEFARLLKDWQRAHSNYDRLVQIRPEFRVSYEAQLSGVKVALSRKVANLQTV